MVSILIVFGLAIPALFLLLLWKYSYWYRQGVPQGNPLKLFADLNDLTVTSTPHFEQYVALSRKFTGKPFYGVYNIARPRLMIRDPDIVKEVLIKKFSSFSENGMELDENTEPILGRDPFFQTGDKWKESRAHFTSLMTPGRLRNMLLQMGEVSKETVEYVKGLKHESGRGDGADVKDISVRYMINLLIRATLSVDAGCFKSERSIFMEMGDKMFDGYLSFMVRFFFLFAPKLIPYFGLSIVPNIVRIFFNKIFQEQKQYRIKNGIKTEDILDIMIKKVEAKSASQGAVQDKKINENDIEVLAVIVMFFMEGFETTSTAASGALVELAKNSELQEKLRRQLLAACPPGKEITEEVLNSVPLLQHCLTESLRKYPPAMMLQRVVTNDVKLQGKTGEEIFLKKGSYVNISVGASHRDPEFFPNPDEYDPERFEDEDQKRCFLAFGDGPRQCPGQKFALMAGKMLIAAILREFKLELSPKTTYPLKIPNNRSLFVLKDIWVRFVPL